MESNENDTNQVKKNYEMKPKGTNYTNFGKKISTGNTGAE